MGVLIGNFVNMNESTFSMLVIQGEKHEWKDIVKTSSLQFRGMLHVSATGKYKNIVVTTIGTSLLDLGLFGFIGNHGSRKSHKFYGLGNQLNSAGYHE